MIKIFRKLGITHKRLPLGASISIAVIALLIITAYGTQAAIDGLYRGQILPGVTVGDRAFGQLTLEQARQKLRQTTDNLQEKGITFCHNDRCIVINAAYTAINDPDLSYDLFTPNNEEALSKAYLAGREGTIVTKLYNQWKLRRHGIHIPVMWKIDQEQIKEYLRTNYSDAEKPAKNTRLLVSPQGNEYTISFENSENGWTFNFDEALAVASGSLQNLESPTIPLVVRDDFPEITAVDRDAITKRVTTLLSEADWKFTYDDESWSLSSATIAQMLELQKSNNEVVIGMNRELFEESLSRPKIVLESVPRDARFKIANNRVIEFQSSEDGVDIVEEASWFAANEVLRSATSSAVNFPLIVTVIPSKKSTASVNDLGITELIAEGRSNFSGSPANRRHNIATGSNTLNGILIAPGEEFSLITALGEIDGAHGYLPELVIKGNETIPEYGGGLCQVGTTIFRATLDGGLPITARRNHSYRVSYYEPAGTDATIYDPWPDYKFINDTENHILIQTHIEGDELIYNFWGTSDGRTVDMTDPVIYNITEPPPTKYIETLDLEPGKIRCTERAHRGADASFDYTVTYPDGEIKEETFKSHYRPWQEVCLIGVEKLSDVQGDAEATDEEPLSPDENSLN